MATTKTKIIQSRLGEREVDLDKVITFPRGIIGFEHLREFTLLQIKEDAPFLLLQSMEEETLGLLVADPFSFLPDYKLKISDADQKMLHATSADELAILVTVAIPPGKPEKTALNLIGPIIISYAEKLGLQSPQIEGQGPSKVYVHMHEVTQSQADQPQDEDANQTK